MKPVLQALILAERIYEDKSSGKKVICGTFNRVTMFQIEREVHEADDGTKHTIVPGGTDFGCPAAYVSLTDVVEGTELVLQFFNQTKNESVLHTGVRITGADRLATIEIVVPLPTVSSFIKEPGTYSLDVLWKGELLGSHRVLVVTSEAKNSGD
jgi:hypothetical protein